MINIALGQHGGTRGKRLLPHSQPLKQLVHWMEQKNKNEGMQQSKLFFAFA